MYCLHNVSLSVHQVSIMFGLHIMIINVLFLNKFLFLEKKIHFTSKITYISGNNSSEHFKCLFSIALFTTHKVCGLFSQFSLKNEAHGE